MTTAATLPLDGRSAVFAGADVCQEAGFRVPEGTQRPLFEDDTWDFTDVIGLPVQLALCTRRFGFSAIADPRWRLVAKELVLALFAPRHPAVAPLPRAHRTALHLRSCAGRLDELTRLFAWLDGRAVESLQQISTQTCEAYMAHRRYVLDEDGTVVSEQSPATRRAAAQVIVDLVNYRELFTADRVAADLRPWGGATASAVAEMPSGRTENKTAPVEDSVLQPMLAAALYVVSTLGPRAVELDREVRENDRSTSCKSAGLRHGGPDFADEIVKLLAEYTRTRTPLPMLAEHYAADRLDDGWAPDDPLLPVATGVLARQAGFSQFWSRWLPPLRGPLEAAVASVGVEKLFARQAREVTTTDGISSMSWSLPLHRVQAVALVGIVRTAVIIVLATVSGMKASELMELRVGCRRPPEEPVPGLTRYRIASKVVKGQPLGGTDDEWVVIEPVYRAIELAEQLHDDPCNGAYCWFTDPSRALCLKLAGTPTADRPLVGMCDSARCPQATHHPCHRPVWAEHVERTGTFLGQLGTTRKTERTRLQGDYDRALRVVAEIDAARTTMNEDSA